MKKEYIIKIKEFKSEGETFNWILSSTDDIDELKEGLEEFRKENIASNKVFQGSELVWDNIADGRTVANNFTNEEFEKAIIKIDLTKKYKAYEIYLDCLYETGNIYSALALANEDYSLNALCDYQDAWYSAVRKSGLNNN